MAKKQLAKAKARPTTSKARKQASTKPRARPQRLPHGLTVMDPQSHFRVPRLSSDGTSTTVGGKVVANIAQTFGASTNSMDVLIITNTGSSNNIATQYTYDTSATVMTKTDHYITTGGLDQDGLTAGRAEKFSVSIMNTSNPLNVEGYVTILQTDMRLGLLLDSALGGEWATTVATWEAHPDAKIVTARDLCSGVRMVGHCVDRTAYNSFEVWKHGSSYVPYAASLMGSASDTPRPMSTIILIFRRLGDAVTPQPVNNYKIALRATYDTRWALNQPMSRVHEVQPIAPQHIVEHVHRTATVAASVLQPAAETFAAGFSSVVAPVARAGAFALGQRGAAVALRAAASAWQPTLEGAGLLAVAS